MVHILIYLYIHIWDQLRRRYMVSYQPKYQARYQPAWRQSLHAGLPGGYPAKNVTSYWRHRYVIGYIPVTSQCHVPMTSKRGIPKDVIKTSHVTSYCEIFITSFLRNCRTSYCDIFIMLFSNHCRTSYCGIFIMSFLHHSGTSHYDMNTYQWCHFVTYLFKKSNQAFIP